MSDRLLKYLAGILAVLLVGWLVARLVSGDGGEAAPFELASAAELELDSVVIAAARDTVRLIATGDGWTANGHEAMAEMRETLRSALEGAEVGPLVSRNPENHARLGVTPDSGRVLNVYAGGEARLTLLIGGRAELFDRAYVRRPGEDEVFTLQGTLVSLSQRRVDDWREREILAAARGDIQRIEYAYGDTTFALARDSAGWRIEPADTAVAESWVAPILSNLPQLRAIGFAADSVTDTLSWSAPTARVRLQGPGDAVIGELEFIQREENVGYYVRRVGSPVVYTLSAFSGNQILKREREIVPSDQ